MGQTIAEQILSHAAGVRVKAGDLVVVRPQVVMSHDSLTPSIIKIMREELGIPNVHDPRQLVMVMDHVVPPSSIDVANNQNIARRFAQEQGVRFFEVGRGVCHQVLVEEGIAQPGMIVVGADSHSTAYGAVGAFGTGMGSTDVALIWATGKTWLRVPETVRIMVRGRFKPWVEAKDLALKVCRELSISGATYAALEYHGIEWMVLSGRQTLAGMAVEVGAKAGIIPAEGEALRGFNAPDWLGVDADAHYARTLTVDLDTLTPQIAAPHAVDNVFDVQAEAGKAVDVVLLGTCTNGRYEDMRIAAQILRGKHIAPNVRLLVTPASSQALEAAAADGSLAILLQAGAALTTPGCGACIGRHQGTLGDDEVCLSSGNRNFRGRMGSPKAQIYLVSPAVAAASALTCVITDPNAL